MKVEKGDGQIKIQANGVEVQIKEVRSGLEVWFKDHCVWPPKKEGGQSDEPATGTGTGTPWHLR